MSAVAAISGLDSANYRPHLLHAPDRIWVEKNCYVDIWIELLHALKLEPLAMLGSTLAIDCEVDQWTFYKPFHEDLRQLYGVEVKELYVWRTLLEHSMDYLAAGTPISTEIDAYWLPDTRGTDYRSQHTKTTIVINELDPQAERLSYFHNSGYHTLEGEDFRQLFRVNLPADPSFLPLFAEYVRVDNASALSPEGLRERAWELLRTHAGHLPQQNPIMKFQKDFAQRFPWLQQQGLGVFHAWAFGTLRQLGAAGELAGLHLQWLGNGEPEMQAAGEQLLQLSRLAKTSILKGARAVNSRKEWDTTSMFEEMASCWSLALSAVRRVK